MESNHPPSSDDEPHGQITPFPRASRKALRKAAQSWIKRGYAIVYEDDHLVELAREDKTPGRWVIALGVGRRRRWTFHHRRGADLASRASLAHRLAGGLA